MSLNEHEALEKSKYELLERLYAFRPMVSRHNLDYGFEGCGFLNNKKNISAEDILIREKGNLLGATGLSIHTNEEKAIEHGVYEVIEKSILCSIWYEGNKLCQISENIIKNSEYIISSYTTVDRNPFVISVIKNKDETVFFSGSALKNNLEESLAHSKTEAMQLICNLLVKEFPPKKLNSESSRLIMSRLVGDSAKEIHNHFNSRIVSHSQEKETLNLRKILLINNFEESTYCFKINKIEDFFCYRCIIENALYKEKSRKIFSYDIGDPFC